jgi:hypothetical protein
MNVKQYNLILAIIHLALGIGFSVYFKKMNDEYPNDAIKGVELSIREHNLEWNSVRETPVWASYTEKSVSIHTVQYLLVGFFFITAIFHAIYYFTNDGLYTQLIQNQNNYLRWIEYSITSTMMLYVIALISGVKDVNVYRSIFIINIAMIYTGQLVEEKLIKGEDWRIPMILGFALLVVEFLIIVFEFQSRMNNVERIAKAVGEGKTIPDWIKYMIWILFLFFSSFGFISLYGAYSNSPYESVEKLYLLFSLLAKATLAGFIAYGTSQRQKSSNS